jgi:hypothetical protein
MPLEFVGDALGDETHAQLDSKVLGRAHCLEDPLRPSDYLRLLQYIALESKECIDPKYKNIDEAEEALDHDEVLAELQVAWKAKAFKNIRNLGTSLHLLLIIYVLTVTHTAILQSPSSSSRNRHQRSWMNSDAQSE